MLKTPMKVVCVFIFAFLSVSSAHADRGCLSIFGAPFAQRTLSWLRNSSQKDLRQLIENISGEGPQSVEAIDFFWSDPGRWISYATESKNLEEGIYEKLERLPKLRALASDKRLIYLALLAATPANESRTVAIEGLHDFLRPTLLIELGYHRSISTLLKVLMIIRELKVTELTFEVSRLPIMYKYVLKTFDRDNALDRAIHQTIAYLSH